jgi:hypothetical protein
VAAATASAQQRGSDGRCSSAARCADMMPHAGAQAARAASCAGRARRSAVPMRGAARRLCGDGRRVRGACARRGVRPRGACAHGARYAEHARKRLRRRDRLRFAASLQPRGRRFELSSPALLLR